MGCENACLGKYQFPGVYSKKTGLDLGITRPGPGEPDRNPLDDAKLAPRSANGSISRSIAWTTSRPPGNVAIVSFPGRNALIRRNFDQINELRLNHSSVSPTRR